MLKHILPLLLPALLFSGCIRMEVPEGFDLSGRWALVDGSGKCSKVLEFSDGREIEYMSGTAYWYQEESLWHCSEDDFTKYYHEYGILDGILYVDGVKQSGISLNKGTLKIGESEYRNVTFESDYYSTVSVETDHILCGTTVCRIEVPYTISRPIKGLLMDIASACDWLTVEEPGADKVVISVLDNNTGNSRNGSILLQYDSAADVRVDVTQSYSAPEIVCNPVSLECSYLAQQCSFEYTVSDSRADAELVAATSDSWISGLNVEDGKVSFNVVENNSSFQRSGTIKLSYILSGTVLATANYSVEQTYSSASVKVSPESTTAAYTGGSFSIDCTIDNPRNGATLTATTATSWISGIKVEDGKMSFNVAENNSGAQRSGTIKMSYGVSGTTYATKDYAVVQNGMPVTSLTLNKTSLEMNAGSSETLVATVTPSDATLVWSSSNTSVATVDGNGKVTAKANGTTTITVKSAYGTETATCAVTVTTAVTGVSLNKTTLSLKIGSSETLVATVAPSTASNKDVTWSSSSTSIATVDGNGKVTAVAKGAATITVKTADGAKTATCAVSVVIPAVAVDLGLSVKWAQCNLGASKPEEYGDYYAWGATEPWYKDGYAQSSSPQWISGKSGGYNWTNCPFNGGNSSYNSSYWNAHKSECVDANGVLLPENDAAHVNLGGNWRMPTKEEFAELANSSNCSWTWTTLNGIKGYKVQSKKSGFTVKWIFLPAAGLRYDADLSNVGSGGYYWSSSLNPGSPSSAWRLNFDSGSVSPNSYFRNYGRSVRPVTE